MKDKVKKLFLGFSKDKRTTTITVHHELLELFDATLKDGPFTMPRASGIELAMAEWVINHQEDREKWTHELNAILNPRFSKEQRLAGSNNGAK